MSKRHSPNKTRTRKPKEDLVFDHTGAVDVDGIRADREPSRTKAVAFTPPPNSEKWWASVAILFCRLNGAEKAVLGCLVDHANITNGRCDPSESCIAWETGYPLRTVKRAISTLLRSPYLSRTRRGTSSNAYHPNWGALLLAFNHFTERKGSWSGQPKAAHQERRHDDATASGSATSGPSASATSGPSVVPEVAHELSKELSNLNGSRETALSPKAKDAIPPFENPSSERGKAVPTNKRLTKPIGQRVFSEEPVAGNIIQFRGPPETPEGNSTAEQFWTDRLHRYSAELESCTDAERREVLERKVGIARKHLGQGLNQEAG